MSAVQKLARLQEQKNELLFKQSALSVRFISDSSSETKKCIITQGK